MRIDFQRLLVVLDCLLDIIHTIGVRQVLICLSPFFRERTARIDLLSLPSVLDGQFDVLSLLSLDTLTIARAAERLLEFLYHTTKSAGFLVLLAKGYISF